MRYIVQFIFVLLYSINAIATEPHFPALTGKVVDQANILSQATRDSLTQKLNEYETATSNQIVVVTLNSLEGLTIEDYGVQLGRSWGIGQKDKNNGALLIIAPNEHAVRIEVGYGLEGTLTDATSSQIIQQIILPEFKHTNIESGIIKGTDAILSVLGGKGIPQTPAQSSATESSAMPSFLNIVLLIVVMIAFAYARVRGFFNTIQSSNLDSQTNSLRGSEDSKQEKDTRGGGGSFGGGGSSGSW